MKSNEMNPPQHGLADEKKRSEWPLILLMIIPIAYLAATWKTIPDIVPIHFNLHGVADDWGSKWIFILLTGVVQVPVYILMYFIPRLDPKKKIRANSKAFYVLRFGITFLLSSISCWIIYTTVNYSKVEFSMKIIPILISAFMILMGNYLPTVKQNYFIGIRTPWTLENNEVWTKTHLNGGRAFFYAGIFCLLASILLPEILSVFIVVGGMLAVSVYSIVISYRYYNRSAGSI